MEPDPPVPQALTLAELALQATQRHLAVLGVVAGKGTSTLLLGPDEPRFWPHFKATPEFADGKPDPMDRWSVRVLGGWAQKIGAEAVFPSDGPPYPPFYAWALQTGQIWASPVGLLVHETLGLWVSFRGALRLPWVVAAPRPGSRPCDTCKDKPCLTTCPVGALQRSGYDHAACAEHILGADIAKCCDLGCSARRQCPAGAPHLRRPEQSAFHMRAFAQ